MDHLETMRVFAAVAAEGSFSGGARRLGVSTAFVSKAVARLEDRLGVRLLQRTTRRLSLTEMGEAYLPACRRLLDELADLESAVRDRQEAPRGRLTMTVPAGFGEDYVMPVLGDFLAAHPGLRAEVIATDRMVDLVADGIDMAIRIGEMADSSLVVRRLAGMSMVLCAAPAWCDAGPPVRDPLDLAERATILDTNAGTAPVWRFAAAGEVRTVPLAPRAVVDSAAAASALAERGLGVAFCPEYAAAAAVAAGRLRVLLPEWSGEALPVVAAYPHSRHLAAKVRLWIDVLAAAWRVPPWRQAGSSR